MVKWYVRTKGRIIGPFPEADIVTMRTTRQIQAFDEVSQDQMNWVAIDLSPIFATGSVAPATLVNSTTFTSGPSIQLPPQRKRKPILDRSGWIIAGGTLASSLIAVIVVALLLRNRTANKPVETDNKAAVLATVPNGLVKFAPNTTASDRDKVLESTVCLIIAGATVKRPDGSQFDDPDGTGTGFVVTADGYILTNMHVVESYQKSVRADLIRDKLKKEKALEITPKLWVFFGKNEKFEAELVHGSENFDLAVLKIKSNRNWYYGLCDKIDTEVPSIDPVFAVGFPGLDRGELNTRNIGVGAVQTIFPDSAFDFSRRRGAVTKRAEKRSNGPGLPDSFFLRHGAMTSYGNSGGPLMTESGQIIGINTQIEAESILKTDKQTGKVTIGHGNANNINFALTLHQMRSELDKHVPGITWQPLFE